MPVTIAEAPVEYDGSLSDLYEAYAKNVLLEPAIVEDFHKQFCAYIQSADPLFLVRESKGGGITQL